MHDPFSTSAYIKKGLFIFISITLLALLYPTVRFFTAPDTSIANPNELDFGLNNFNDVAEEAAQALTSAAGYLYLYGALEQTAEDVAALAADGNPTDAPAPSLFAYNLAAAALTAVPTLPADTANAIPGIFVGRNDTAESPADAIHPAWVEYDSNLFYFFDTPSRWHEVDLRSYRAADEDKSYVVYAAANQQMTPGDGAWLEIANREIIVHYPYTNQTRTIPAAFRPQIINDGADILYVKEDGVYRYNLAAEASELVAGSWNNLTTNVGLAAASDSSAFVLTVPELDTIAVYTFTDSLNGEAVLQGMIAEEGTSYFDPVMSPDGRQYATLVGHDSDWNQNTGNYNSMRVEIRDVLDRTVRGTIPVEFTDSAPVYMLDWRTELEPFEIR